MSGFSKTQIDKLGERLREGDPVDDDLRMLDEYRSCFKPVFDGVQEQLRTCGVVGEITGRAAKTTSSIIQKLQREQTRHVRLSQVQDICGLRVVVASIDHQNEVVRRLLELFPESAVDDRRENPSHGYRAVHVIASPSGLPVEIQVRTIYQHVWAQFCEQLADKLGIEVKYGGHPAAQNLLNTLSDTIRSLEDAGSSLIRVNLHSSPMARQELLMAFHDLIRFMEQAPQSNAREVDHVLPD